MNKSRADLLHSFVIGIFFSAILLSNIWTYMLLTIILTLGWRNFITPIIGAFILDMTFASDRILSNFYGFTLTMSTIILTIILLNVRKLLNL